MGSPFHPLSMRPFIFSAFLWVLLVLCGSGTCHEEHCELWVDWRNAASLLHNGTLEDPVGTIQSVAVLLALYPACANRAIVNFTPGGIYDAFYIRSIPQITFRKCVVCPKLDAKPSPPLPPSLGTLSELSTIISDPTASPSYRAYLEAIQVMNPEDEVFLPIRMTHPVMSFQMIQSNVTIENVVFYIETEEQEGERRRGENVSIQEAQNSSDSVSRRFSNNMQDEMPDLGSVFVIPTQGSISFQNVLFLGSHRLLSRSLVSTLSHADSTLIMNNVTMAHFRLAPWMGSPNWRGSSLIVISQVTSAILQNCLFYDITYESNTPGLDLSFSGASIASAGYVWANQTAFLNSSTLYFPEKNVTERGNEFFGDQSDFLRFEKLKNSDHEILGWEDKLFQNSDSSFAHHFKTLENTSISKFPEMHGGAVAISEGKFELRGGWFLYNRLRLNRTLLDQMMDTLDVSSLPSGGALSFGGSSEVYLFDVRFEQNEAPFGAAVSSGSSAKVLWYPRTVNFSHRGGSYIFNHALITAADLWTRGYTTSILFYREIAFTLKGYRGPLSGHGINEDATSEYEVNEDGTNRNRVGGVDQSRLAISLSLEHDNNYAPSSLLMIRCTYRGDPSAWYNMRAISVHGFSLVSIASTSFSSLTIYDVPVIHASHVADFKLRRSRFYDIVSSKFSPNYLEDGAFILINHDQSTSPWGSVPARPRIMSRDTIQAKFNPSPNNQTLDSIHPSDSRHDPKKRLERKMTLEQSDFDSRHTDPNTFDLEGCPFVSAPARAPPKEPVSVTLEDVTFEHIASSWSLLRISYVDKVRISKLNVSQILFTSAGTTSPTTSKLIYLSDIRQYAILNEVLAQSISAVIYATRINLLEMTNLTMTFLNSRPQSMSGAYKTEARRESQMFNDQGDHWKHTEPEWKDKTRLGDIFSHSKPSATFNQNRYNRGQQTQKESFGALMIKHCGSVYLSGSLFVGFQSLRTRVTPVMIEDTMGSVYVVDSIFVNNEANQEGGALSLSSFSSTSAVILRCSFIGNSATFGGAISTRTPLIVAHSEFIGNRASYAGGAIYSVSPLFCATFTLFSTNNANATGGAVVLAGSGFALVNNATFLSNTVGPYEAGHGGAISLINTLYFSSYYTTFKSNAAPNGGAISFTKDTSQAKAPRPQSKDQDPFKSGTRPRMDDELWRSLKRVITEREGQNQGDLFESFPFEKGNSLESENSSLGTSLNSPFVASFGNSTPRSNLQNAILDETLGAPPLSRVSLGFSQFVGNQARSNSFSVDAAMKADLGIWPSDLSEQKTFRGGALFVSELNHLTILASHMRGNLARVGGAVYASSLLTFLMNDTTLANNNASYAGGAVAIFSRLANNTNKAAAEGVNWEGVAFDKNGALYGGVCWLSTTSPTPISIQKTTITHNTASLGSVWYHSGHEMTIPVLTDTTMKGNKARKAASAIFYNGPPLTSPQRLQNFCSIHYACYQDDDSMGPSWSDTRSASSGFNLTVLLTPQFPSNINSRVLTTTPFAPRILSYGGDSTDNILTSNSNCRLVNPHSPWPAEDDLSSPIDSHQNKLDPIVFHPGNLSIDFNLRDALDQRIDDRNTYSTCFSLAENENDWMKVLLRPATINSAITTTVSVTVAVRSDLVDRSDSVYIKGSHAGRFSLNSTLIVGLENASATTGSMWSLEPYRFREIPLTMVKLTVQGCPRGYGLTNTNSEPDYAVCAPCTEGTYNLDGDGRCWLCDDPELPYTLVTCSGANVRPTTGVYVLPSTHDNSFLTFACPFGYCTNCSASSSDSNHDLDKQCPFGDCAEGRDPNTCLCGACASGYSESLLFDTCSRHWCHTPNYPALILVSLGLAAAALTLHHFWFFHPSATSLLLFFLQVLPLVHVDFLLLLQRSSTLAGFFCLAPATPLQRLIFFHLIPLYLAAVLLLSFLLRFSILYLYGLFRHCVRSLFPRSHGPVGISHGKIPLSSSVLPSPLDADSSPAWDDSSYEVIDTTTNNLLINDAEQNPSNSSDESVISFGSFDSTEYLLISDFIMMESSNDTIQGKKAKFLEDRPAAPQLLRASSNESGSTELSAVKVADGRTGVKKELVSRWDQRVRLPYFHTARLTRSLMAIWVLTIIPTTKLAFDFLHCVAIEERPTVWFVAPSVSCSSRSFTLLRNIALPFIVGSLATLIGLFFFTMQLYRNVVMGHSKHLKLLLHLAYFFDSFRPGLYFWMLLHIALRIVLPMTVALSFIKPGPFNFATSIVLLSATLVQAFSWSYTDLWDNVFSSILLTTLTVSSLLRESSFQSSVVGYAPPSIIIANYVLLLSVILAMVAVNLFRRFSRKS